MSTKIYRRHTLNVYKNRGYFLYKKEKMEKYVDTSSTWWYDNKCRQNIYRKR